MVKYISILFLFMVFLSNAQSTNTFFSKTDVFLKQNVTNNKIDYQSIKKAPDLLNDIIDIIEKTDITKENANTQKAFLINAYNLILIKAVVSKYPVKSPLDVPGLFDKSTYLVGGKKYTLNDIENKLIRAKYNDPTVHFVLVCCANGCPPITNFAYMPNTLEEQLNKQTKLAINNPNFIKINSTSKKLEISQIFEWYKEDFVSKTSKEIDFLNQFRETKIDTKYKVSYYPYDWTLNKK